MIDCGIVYAAIGKLYAREAALSARSLKARHPKLPVALFTDRQPQDAEPFDRIEILQTLQPIPHLDKLVAMRRSPFDRTLFLDTDTYVCGKIAPLFALLDEFDIAMSVERRYAAPPQRGTSIPEAFGEFNQGVVLFRRSAAFERVLEEALNWADAERRRSGTPLDDQTALRVALYGSALRISVLSDDYNCRFHGFGSLVGAVKILHGRIPQQPNKPCLLEEVARKLNRRTVPRVFVAGKVIALNRVRIGKAQHFVPRFQAWLFNPYRALARHTLGGAIRRTGRAVRTALTRRPSAPNDAS